LVCLGDLRHHAFAREQASERRTSIAPMSPGIVRPILIVSPLSGSRIVTEGLEQKCSSLLRVGLRDRISLVPLGESRKRVRFAYDQDFARSGWNLPGAVANEPGTPTS
jgi:hypothetical protein